MLILLALSQSQKYPKRCFNMKATEFGMSTVQRSTVKECWRTFRHNLVHYVTSLRICIRIHCIRGSVNERDWKISIRQHFGGYVVSICLLTRRQHEFQIVCPWSCSDVHWCISYHFCILLDKHVLKYLSFTAMLEMHILKPMLFSLFLLSKHISVQSGFVLAF